MTRSPFEFLTLSIVPSEPPAIHQFQFCFSYSSIGCKEDFVLVSVAFYIHLSFQFGGHKFTLCPYLYLRGIVDFSMCSAFSLVSKTDGMEISDFWAHYMPDYKL